jgi:hypothetical protein
VYSCILQCGNKACEEVVANSGVGSVDYFYYYDDANEETMEEYYDQFTPRFFEPPLVMIQIPKNCPKGVTEALQESFRLYFSSPGSAVISIRIAIEELLTGLGIIRFEKSKGKAHRLSLHSRITSLPNRYENERDILLAAKWLGNAGSHSGKEITADDVLDAFEFMEYVLGELYEPKAKRLVAHARRVNKQRGPVKSRQKKQ